MTIENKDKWKRVKYTTLLLGVSMVICFSTYIFIIYQDLQKPGVVVLLFHEIIGNDQKWSNKYQHRLSDFAGQLDYLVQEGYTTILPSELSQLKAYKGHQKIIILTFDDGTRSHYNKVYPLLRERKLKGVFFVIAENINKKYGLSDSQLVEMSNNGMEIGSHSYSHPFLDELGKEDLYFQLQESRKILSYIIGKEVTSFAPPGGWYNDSVVKAAKDIGYTAFFTCEIGVNDITQPIYEYKRIEVTGDMTLDEFKELLTTSHIVDYKIIQSIKFLAHRLVGSDLYLKLSEAL